MKKSKILKRILYVSMAGAGMLFIQGCVVYQGYNIPPVTVSDILQMTKDSVPPDQIIEKIKESNTVYRLTAEQLAQLSKDGVSPQVLNYMEETHLEAVRQNQQLEDWNYWWPGWDGYWYGGPAFGWPPYYWNYNWGYEVHIPHGYEGHRGDSDRR